MLSGCGGGGDSEQSQATNAQAPAREGRASVASIDVSSDVVAGVTTGGEAWAAVPPGHQLAAATPIPACASGVQCRYYIDSHYGGTGNGTKAAPFKSLAEFSQALNRASGTGVAITLKPYDAILLKCGSLFREQLKFDGSTNPKLPKGVRIGAYSDTAEDCTDATLPVISGSDPAGSWTTPQGSSFAQLPQITNAFPYRLFKVPVPPANANNGLVPFTKARYPDPDPGAFFAKASATPAAGTTSTFPITTTDQTEVANHSTNGSDAIVGSVVLVRTTAFTIEAANVTAYSNGVVTVSPQFKYAVPAGAGYVFQGKRWMANQPGEWFLENGVPYHYGPISGSAEAEGSRVYGLQLVTPDSVSIERIRFENQMLSAIEIKGAVGVTIRGVESVNAGHIGIGASTEGSGNTAVVSTGTVITGSRVLAAGSIAIMTADATKSTVNDNYVADTGRYLRSEAVFPIVRGAAIRLGRDASEAKGNYILNSGGAALTFEAGYGDAVPTGTSIPTSTISNNIVIKPCLQSGDCGGISTRLRDVHLSTAQLPEFLKKRTEYRASVIGNTIVGNKSNRDGCLVPDKDRPGPCDLQAVGIYLDDYTSNVNVSGNWVSGVEVGIYVHNGAHNNIQGNTVRSATYESFLVSYDSADTDTEIVRGNTVRDNNFVSRRAVLLTDHWDTTTYNNGAMPMFGVPHTYAQLWRHKTNPAAFFTGDARNISEKNKTRSLTKVEQPALWRMGPSGQLEQSSGAIWGLHKLGSAITENALPDWLKAAPPTAPDLADTESSPVSYRPFAPKTGAVSLIDDFVENANWTAVSGNYFRIRSGSQPDPLCDGLTACGEATPTQGWNLVASRTFKPVYGDVYLASYQVKAGQAGGAFNSSIMVDGTWARASNQYVQSNYFGANQSKRIEHFFMATSSDSNTKVFLRPSDGSDAYAKPMYFSRASLYPVKSLDTLSLSTLAATAVNTTGIDRNVSCSSLGFGSTCPTQLVDEDGIPVTLPSAGMVTVPKSKVLQIYQKVSPWFNN